MNSLPLPELHSPFQDGGAHVSAGIQVHSLFVDINAGSSHAAPANADSIQLFEFDDGLGLYPSIQDSQTPHLPAAETPPVMPPAHGIEATSHAPPAEPASPTETLPAQTTAESAGARIGDTPTQQPQHIHALRETAKHSRARVVSFPVRNTIEALVKNVAVPHAVFVGPAASQFASSHGADAVAVGDDIFIASPDYSPATPAGMALLAHEATHTAQFRLQPAMTADLQEQQAMQSESVVLNHFHTTPAPASPSPFVPPANTATPLVNYLAPAPAALPDAGPAPVVQTALTNRHSSPQAASGYKGVTDAEMKRIKEEIYRDLITRIRNDIERGA